MKIRIIPTKNTYLLNEKVLDRIEFVNLTDKTLCFPKPARDCYDSGSGDLVSRAEFAEAGERDWFHCGYDGGGPSAEKLLAEIENSWIKLAPNQVYVTEPSIVEGNSDRVGKWRIQVRYRPPEGAFNPARYRAFLETGAQSIGCTVPEFEVPAKPVVVDVVLPPGGNQGIK